MLQFAVGVLQIVHYSDHSPFIELRQFVEAVNPRKVRPIVTKFTGDQAGRALSVRCNMAVFDDYLDKSEKVRHLSLNTLPSLFTVI